MRFLSYPLLLLGPCSLMGCAYLPPISSQAPLPSQAASPLTLVDSRGTLATPASQTVIARLTKQAPTSAILQRHLQFEESISGAPLVLGNKVSLLTDGPITYAAIFEVLAAARDHINLETYTFESDALGQRLAELLLRKQREGVQVNIIYDAVGTLNTPDTFFEPLRAEGACIVKFNPINPLEAEVAWSLNNRDHRKILVVDGKTVFTGGVNISSVYSKSAFRRHKKDDDRRPETSAWRDTHVQIEGPVVAEFQKLFFDTWRRQNGPALPQRDYFPVLSNKGEHIVRVIGSSPATPDFDIYRTLLSAIDHADNFVHITNAYFVPDRRLIKALKQAAMRGVDVKLILPSHTDSSAALHAGRSHYATLLKSGVKIYERRDVLLHAKTIVVDGVWSSVGTTNLDMRSFFHNDEVNAVILGPEFVSKMEALFAQDLQHSEAITLDKWRNRPLWQRLKEATARLIEYWL